MLFLSLDKSVFFDKLPSSNNLMVWGFINCPLIKKQLFGFFNPDGDRKRCCSFFFDPEKIAKYETSPS